LNDLSRAEATALLDVRGVPARARESVLGFAGGHPLALTLAAVAAAADTSRWRPTPDVLTTLMRQVIGEVPSAAHRLTLQVAAHTLTVTEQLLQVIVGEDAGQLFSWLCQLPFVQLHGSGVVLHELVREVVDADFRWRDFDGYTQMHERVGAYVLEQARTAATAGVMPVMRSLIYLKRHGPAAPYFATLGHEGDVYEDAATPSDRTRMRELTAECEGSESAAIMDFWFDRRPEAFWAYRESGSDQLVGYLAWLRLGDLTGQEAATDPVTATAWAHLCANGPLRPGEDMLIARFMIHPEAYHQISPVTHLTQMRLSVDWIRSRLAWSFISCSNPEFWEPLMRQLGKHQLPAAVTVGRRQYAIFGCDWRLTSPVAYFHRMAGVPGTERPAALSQPRGIVLPQDEFSAAVRAALRDWHRTDDLNTNPLMRSRLVTRQAGPRKAPVAVLRELIMEAAAMLNEDPKKAALHRVLTATYFERATSQAAVAARLHVPWSTYRRHLKQATEHICTRLWHWDLADEKPPEAG
jgi:hypothetical protein